jgi:hypothetical protein
MFCTPRQTIRVYTGFVQLQHNDLFIPKKRRSYPTLALGSINRSIGSKSRHVHDYVYLLFSSLSVDLTIHECNVTLLLCAIEATRIE